MSAADLIALAERNDRLTKLVFQCAPDFQGGHSDVGYEISEVLGVGFPLSMPSLRAEAIERGYMPYDLWPWLEHMERARAAQEGDA